MNVWQHIKSLLAGAQHARTLLGLAWLGIILALVSTATGARLVFVSVALGTGVVALAMVGIFCVLVKLANILTENGKVPAVNLTKTAATQQSVTH
jgi:hypothetical protein